MDTDTATVADPTRAGLRFSRVIPLAFVAYGLAYFDRVNYGYGLAGGLAKTVHMSNSVSSLVAALFFIGYMAFQIPGAGYAARHSAKKLIFWALILWGVLCSMQGIVTNAWAMIAEMVPRNVVGESMALVNSAGALGGFAGTYLVGFLIGYFHSDGAGFLFLAVMLVAAGLISAMVRPQRTVQVPALTIPTAGGLSTLAK